MGSRSDMGKLVISYLAALSNQDFKTARSYLKDGMSFQAPIASYNSADEYFKGNEMLRSRYGIEKVVYDVKKIFADGDDACAFFDFSVGPVTTFACGWFRIDNGKISSIRVVFDPRSIVELTPKK